MLRKAACNTKLIFGIFGVCVFICLVGWLVDSTFVCLFLSFFPCLSPLPVCLPVLSAWRGMNCIGNGQLTVNTFHIWLFRPFSVDECTDPLLLSLVVVVVMMLFVAFVVLVWSGSVSKKGYLLTFVCLFVCLIAPFALDTIVLKLN